MADVVTIPLGKDAVLYFAAAGAAAPAVAVGGVTDLSVLLDKDMTEVTRRISGGWEDHREAIKRLGLSFTLMGTTKDTAGSEVTTFDHFRVCFLTGVYSGSTGMALHAVSHTAALGGKGPLADFSIHKFERAENLGDAQVYAVECRMIQTQSRTVSWANSPV